MNEINNNLGNITYQISRAGNIIGTYNVETLRAALNSSLVLPTDYAWTSGMPEWRPVSVILSINSPSAVPDSGQIREVATKHRAIILLLLLQIFFYILYIYFKSFFANVDQSSSPISVCLFYLYFIINSIILVFTCMNVHNLAIAFRSRVAFLWVIAAAMPCLNILILLILSQRSIIYLKSNGVHVGFLGADTSKL